MEVEDEHKENLTDTPESLNCDKDFIYVEDASSDSSTDQKSILSYDVCKKSESSETSSFSEVQPVDLEPKMGASEHGDDVSKLVEEAQLDDVMVQLPENETVTNLDMDEPLNDFLPNYYNGKVKNSEVEESELKPTSLIGLQTLKSVDSALSDEDSCSTEARRSSESDVNDACVLYHNIIYLGSSTIYAPVSDLELRRTISILRDNTSVSMKITLAISLVPNGVIRLINPSTHADIAMYNIDSICYWGKGDPENREKDCLAFNISHGKDEPSYHCHVFKCEEEDNVARILQSLASTIKKDKKRKQDEFPRVDPYFDTSNLVFKFNIILDIWEEDGKGQYQTVARDKHHFKLRRQFQRKVVLVIEQISNKRLRIEKCFGFLLAQGKDVPDHDFHLLQQIQKFDRPEGRVLISGHWDPNTEQWKYLNTDTGKDNRMTMTVAADLIFCDLKEPVRILKEAKVRIFPTNEKFWSPTKPRIQEEYVLQLKESFTESGERFLEKESLRSASEIAKSKGINSHSSSSISSLWRSSKHVSERASSKESETEEPMSTEEEDEDDEPLLSGSGEIIRESTDEELQCWQEIMEKWTDVESRPSKVLQLVRKGIPPSLRGEIWLKMVGFDDQSELLNSYKYLIQKDSPQEQVILWDVTRTFPGHEYFRVAGGDGQKALYNISKAYSVYDEEVGYCQGLSFLIAVFLLHVTEEQAYCLLVSIMFEYGHRENFNNSFELLHQSFYILDRLMEDYMQDLFLHFQAIHVEAHMFASQWLLTMFTAKFPLCLVYHFIDILLCEGCDVMFQIALALLKDSRKELLLLDFEGVLKYFRVNLPKKYMNETLRKDLCSSIYSFKISKKRLEKYKEEYNQMQAEMASKEDPIARLQREHQRMYEESLRLERENDSLAYEIVTTQVSMQEVITDLEEKVNDLTKQTEKQEKHLQESEEEIERLKVEEARVKAMWRESMSLADNEKASRDRIIEDYKQILTNLEARNEKVQKEQAATIETLKNQVSTCDSCTLELLNGVHNNEGNENDEVSTQKNSLLSLLHDNDDSQQQIRNIEAELIQAKVALAEEKNRADELELRLHNITVASEKPWYKNFSIHNKR